MASGETDDESLHPKHEADAGNKQAREVGNIFGQNRSQDTGATKDQTE